MAVIEIDARFMEDAVLAAVKDDPRLPYWRERDCIYGIADVGARERAFTELNRRHFEALDLAAPLRRALAEQPLVGESVQACRVFPASSARDECAELYVAGGDAGEGRSSVRWVVIRARPALFSAPEALLGFLRHELQHIADMVDPAFGYDPAMPEVEGGALRLKLVLSRYRVLWDTVIDGRLVARGHAPRSVRGLRLHELEKSFPMLREHTAETFDRLFHDGSPRHAALLELALHPRRAMGLAELPDSAGICPLCACPGDLSAARSSLTDTGLSDATCSAIAADFPAWQRSDGVCFQCSELYRARVFTIPATVCRLVPK